MREAELGNLGFPRGFDGLIWMKREVTLCTKVLQKCYSLQHASVLLYNLPFVVVVESFFEQYSLSLSLICWHLYVLYWVKMNEFVKEMVYIWRIGREKTIAFIYILVPLLFFNCWRNWIVDFRITYYKPWYT